MASSITPLGGRHHLLKATPGMIHTGFFDNSLKPVLTIDSGDIVTMETLMLMDGRLRPGMSVEDISELKLQYLSRGRSTHSLTGPVYVGGAKPGDVLEVRIHRLVLHPQGIHYVMPGQSGAGTLPEEFPAGHAKSFRWDDRSGSIDFGHGIELPLRPFLGIMAVAPAQRGEISATPPGPHGGNMDLKELVEGTTIYFPVFVPGALFSAGDAHAVQGDGEVSGTALESAAKEVQLQFVVRQDVHLERPMAETDTYWITMGFHTDLDEAAKIALLDAINWIVQIKDISRLEAYSLCCLAVDLRVTQLVDRNKGIHAMIPKSIFK